jgi:hypothetical protein
MRRSNAVCRHYKGRTQQIKAEQQLHSIRFPQKNVVVNCFAFNARNVPGKTPCPLFSFDAQLPKLDVAGSNPVSRSKINNLQAPCPVICSFLFHFLFTSLGPPSQAD